MEKNLLWELNFFCDIFPSKVDFYVKCIKLCDYMSNPHLSKRPKQIAKAIMLVFLFLLELELYSREQHSWLDRVS